MSNPTTTTLTRIVLYYASRRVHHHARALTTLYTHVCTAQVHHLDLVQDQTRCILERQVSCSPTQKETLNRTRILMSRPNTTVHLPPRLPRRILKPLLLCTITTLNCRNTACSIHSLTRRRGVPRIWHRLLKALIMKIWREGSRRARRVTPLQTRRDRQLVTHLRLQASLDVCYTKSATGPARS